MVNVFVISLNSAMHPIVTIVARAMIICTFGFLIAFVYQKDYYTANERKRPDYCNLKDFLGAR